MTHGVTSTTLHPTAAQSTLAEPGAPAPEPTSRSAAPPNDISTIGDIVLAGQPTGYAHLRARGTPTVGRYVTAAREAAAVLSRPALWPRRRGRWQRATRPARRAAHGRMRVTVVALAPDDAVALPPIGAHGRVSGTDVLRVAHGRAHMVVSAPDGELRAVRELGADRSRVLVDAGRHLLVNSGAETTVVVRVTGP